MEWFDPREKEKGGGGGGGRGRGFILICENGVESP